MDERKEGEHVRAGGERADEAELITLCWATFDSRRSGERVLPVGEKALRRRFKRHGTLLRVGVLGGIFFPESARDYAALERWGVWPG